MNIEKHGFSPDKKIILETEDMIILFDIKFDSFAKVAKNQDGSLQSVANGITEDQFLNFVKQIARRS